MRCIIFFLTFLLIFTGCTREKETILRSPDHQVIFDLTVGEVIDYRVKRDNDLAIGHSRIAFEFLNAPVLGKKMKITAVEKNTVDRTWKPVLKRYSDIRNHYNEMIVSMQEIKFPGRNIQLEVRAYDDGVAFRIHFLPRDPEFTHIITQENTEFNFTGNHKCWAAEYGGFDTHQEAEFSEIEMLQITTEMITGLPLTAEVEDDLYVAITEAALVDYAGMYLTNTNNKEAHLLRSLLSPRQGHDREGEKVQFKGAHTTPWRVIMIGDSPGDLVESEIVQNLNEPCAIEETDWIRPGISAWDHWWSGDVKMEQDVVLEYIDLAAEMGWEYMLIDWQWYGRSNVPDADITTVAPHLKMEEILVYAKEKNVKCWLWLHWTDMERVDFDAACALYNDWGIAGVKIDFMARDDQEMVNWYHDVVKTAADHQLMVDFHGAYKPTGWRRTYPNLITREGVLGSEYNKWSYRVTPEHDCTLPFTRMLAGPMDYTPGGFLNTNKGEFRPQTPTMVQGTRAHELAKFVIFDSPFMVACDHPDNYKGQTGRDFLQEVVSVWDDTKVLNGKIGEYITMARRDGDRWFLASMTNSMSRELEVKLDFLDEGTSYAFVGFADNDATLKDARHVKRQTLQVTSEDKISIWMAPGGGYAGFLVPRN